jgi:hypothetical protein
MYSPVPYMLFIFHDRKLRESRPQNKIKSDFRVFVLVAILSVLVYGSCIGLFCLIGVTKGFNSEAMEKVGHVSGILGFIIEIVQFIPQVYTTIKLRDSGSLSLLMLEIQAPVNLMNAFFMWFGNGESWTTFSASMADGVWEFILLAICLYFNSKKKKKVQEAVLKDLDDGRGDNLLEDNVNDVPTPVINGEELDGAQSIQPIPNDVEKEHKEVANLPEI